MQDKNICATCGHDKWSHAISLKGEVGACMRETIKGWSWCSCEKFTPPNTARTRLTVGGGKLPAKKSNRKGSAPAKSG